MTCFVSFVALRTKWSHFATTEPLFVANTTRAVLELCGGELREISNLEMMKRNDIEIEEVFDEDDEEEIGSIDNFL